MQFEVTIEHAGFTGKATLDFPTKIEKAAMLEDLVKAGVDRESDIADKMAAVKQINGILEKRIIAVDLVHTESGTKIDKVELLDVFSEGQQLLAVFSGFLVSGVPLSKSMSSPLGAQ